MFITVCPQVVPPIQNNIFNVAIITGNNAIKMLEWNNSTTPTPDDSIMIQDVPVVCVEGNNWRSMTGITWRMADVYLNIIPNWGLLERPRGTNEGQLLMGGMRQDLPRYVRQAVMEIKVGDTYNCLGFGNWMQPILTLNEDMKDANRGFSRMFAGWIQIAPVVDLPNLIRSTWRSTEAIPDTDTIILSSDSSPDNSFHSVCSESPVNRMYRAQSLLHWDSTDSETSTIVPNRSNPRYVAGPRVEYELTMERFEAFLAQHEGGRPSVLNYASESELAESELAEVYSEEEEIYAEEVDREGEER